MKYIREGLERWNSFWFEFEALPQLGVFRAGLAVTLFIMYSIRGWQFDLFYSSKGLLTTEMAKIFQDDFSRPAFFLFFENDQLMFGLYLLFLFLLLLLALGVFGRSLCWLVFLLHLVFYQRNPAINYGADAMGTFFLFYLCFTNSNVYFSLPFRRQHSQPDIFSSMGLRLVQIQLCVIYAYTGLEKMQGRSWWEGSAVWKVLGNSQLAPHDFSYFVHFPVLVFFMTWLTLLFEIYFPAVIWYKKIRPFWLLLGLSFHIGAAFFMGLYFFSSIMIISYVLFLSKEQVEGWLFRIRSRLLIAN